MPARPYQLEALAKLRAAVRAGARRVLLVAPTGSGKTFVASESIMSTIEGGRRVLVLAHRQELLNQFWGALYRDRQLQCGIIRADDSRKNQEHPVQLASVATLVRRDRPEADVVWIDEAHRTPGESYQRILECYPRAIIVGLTATPCRLDGKPLREHFDVMIEVAKYSQLIDEGHIVAPRVFAPRRGVDLSGVKRIAGDYHEGQLEKVMLRPHVIGDVVAEWKEHAENRSTVVFSVGVEHSMALANQFRAEGIAAAHLDASTSEDERLKTLMDLETGRIRVVCNVGILCEGWDQPRVKCAVLARPTLSLTLHMQTAGRVMRPWEGVNPVILDHAGNCERHGLPHEDREWSLEDDTAKRVGAVKARICPACYAYVEKSPCELCGFMPEGKPRELHIQPGKLAEIKPPESPERAFFDKMADKCRALGWKPGAASAQYKEKFGAWPPYSWSQKLKAEFEASPEWRERQRHREAAREHWQAKRAAEIKHLEELPAASNEPEYFTVKDL